MKVDKSVRVKNAKYIDLGNNFFAGKNVVIEAWDEYNGEPLNNMPSIHFGDNVALMDNCQVSCVDHVYIGSNVLCGSNVFITDNLHGKSTMEELAIAPLSRKLYSKGPVIIGNNVWLGRNVCVMPGVTIGEGSVVGANSVVTHDVPECSVVAGVPAKLIRKQIANV